MSQEKNRGVRCNKILACQWEKNPTEMCKLVAGKHVLRRKYILFWGSVFTWCKNLQGNTTTGDLSNNRETSLSELMLRFYKLC